MFVAKKVSEKIPGIHDIDKALTVLSNDRIVIHDSQGFEAGEGNTVQKILEFINRRCNMPALADRLHAIW